MNAIMFLCQSYYVMTEPHKKAVLSPTEFFLFRNFTFSLIANTFSCKITLADIFQRFYYGSDRMFVNDHIACWLLQAFIPLLMEHIVH